MVSPDVFSTVNGAMDDRPTVKEERERASDRRRCNLSPGAPPNDSDRTVQAANVSPRSTTNVSGTGATSDQPPSLLRTCKPPCRSATGWLCHRNRYARRRPSVRVRRRPAEAGSAGAQGVMGSRQKSSKWLSSRSSDNANPCSSKKNQAPSLRRCRPGSKRGSPADKRSGHWLGPCPEAPSQHPRMIKR